MTKTHCGYIGIIGRPNVGKSTLLNNILGQKLSIISHKQQTTRHNLLGIKTKDNVQTIYVDTPGIHLDAKRELNRYMNQAARNAIYDVDVIVFVVDVLKWTREDESVLERLRELEKPVILVINKVDEIKDKSLLLPKLDELSQKMDFAAVIPISALKKVNIDGLESEVKKYLSEAPFFFPEDQVTDQQDGFLVAEIIREKLFQVVHQEIPYSSTVVIEKMERKKKVLHIYATIYVEKKGQKTVVIGKGGERIKLIGKSARHELEKKYDCQVYLQLWLKVKDGWVDNARMMKDLGFGE